MISTVRARVALISLCVAVGAGLPAVSRGAVSPVQTVTGDVAAPTRFAPDPTWQTWPKVQRDVWRETSVNGGTGYTFSVNPASWGGRFVLETTGGATGDEDLDITWYASYGALSPIGQAATSPGGSARRGAGGETGIVPAESRYGMVTMFYGADATFEYRAFKPAPARSSRSAVYPAPPKPGIHAAYGRDARQPLATALKKRSHVVIALIDTGINPYNVAYRRPEYVVHPSLYVEGFPKSAPAIGLRLGEPSYVKARNADDAPVWSKVKERSLYWIPGTNIIGAYSHRDYFSELPLLGDSPIEGVTNMPRPIIDDSGHGTGVSSVAAGAGFGANPDALIVVVEGFGEDAVNWAASQPWIDFISGSYGDPTATPFVEAVPRVGPQDTPADPVDDEVGDPDSREYRHTGPFVLRDGRTACFSAGNGLTRTALTHDRYSSLRPTSGPSWIVTVGAASPRNDNNYGWHSVPVDVASYGMFVTAADYTSVGGRIEDFNGTSSATPLACGVFSKVLLDARRALGDTREGIHAVRGRRVPAAGRRGPGLLSDGMLTREELQDAVFKTAQPAEFDPVSFSYDPTTSVPTTPAYYTGQGYGIVNPASGRRATAVVLGKSAMPDRADVDRWIAAIDSIRDALWNPDDYR